MNKEDIIRMAREAGLMGNPLAYADWYPKSLERFAALVEAHVNAKEKERQRYDIHSCGPDCDRYICVAVRKEREKHKASIEFLSRTVDIYKAEVDALHQEQRNDIAEAIRARSNT